MIINAIVHVHMKTSSYFIVFGNNEGYMIGKKH